MNLAQTSEATWWMERTKFHSFPSPLHVCCGTHMPHKHTYLHINKCKHCLMKQKFTLVINEQSFKVHSPRFSSEFSLINNRKGCKHSNPSVALSGVLAVTLKSGGKPEHENPTEPWASETERCRGPLKSLSLRPTWKCAWCPQKLKGGIRSLELEL